MSCLLLSGFTGAGKTYLAFSNYIIPALQSGKYSQIITNISFNSEEINKLSPKIPLIQSRDFSKLIHFYSYLDDDSTFDLLIDFKDYFELSEMKSIASRLSLPENFLDFSEQEIETFISQRKEERKDRKDKPRATLFVIDECHTFFYKRGVKMDSPVVVFERFFAKHRHYGCDILLITQNVRKLNTNISDLVDNLIWIQKALIIGRKDSYIKKTYNSVKRAKSNLLSTNVEKYNPAYFPYFNSTFSKVPEVGFQVGSIFKSGTFKFLFWFGLILFFVFLWVIAGFFENKEQQIEETQNGQDGQQQQQQQEQRTLEIPTATTKKETEKLNYYNELDVFEGFKVSYNGYHQIGFSGDFMISLYDLNGNSLGRLTYEDITELGYVVVSYSRIFLRLKKENKTFMLTPLIFSSSKKDGDSSSTDKKVGVSFLDDFGK